MPHHAAFSDRPWDNPYETAYGSEKVSLFVGSEKTAYVVHKELLCRKSEYFDRMFNGKFQEARTGCAYFPEDKAQTFYVLLYWVYKNHLPDRTRGIERDLGERERGFEFSWNAFAVYNLADRLLFPVLQDLVMDSMRSTSVMEGSW
jgi:hypothetical protein